MVSTTKVVPNGPLALMSAITTNMPLASVTKVALTNVAVQPTDFPKAKVVGHRDFPGVAKECPCLDVAKEYGYLNEGIDD